MPRMQRSAPARPPSCSTSRRSPPSICAAADPASRETELLAAHSTVERVDAIALSGGSAFGLDATSGVQAWLHEQGRGYAIGSARVPIVPGAIVFDLLSGGDKQWGRFSPYRELGYQAAAAAGADFALGSAGGGLGATTANLKGGIGSASAMTADGITVGALVVVNAVGNVTIGDGPHFWAAPFEQNGEFGGRGWPKTFGPDALAIRTKGGPREATTIALVATDAILTKAQCHRLAVMAQTGMRARDLSGAYAARRRHRVRGLDREEAPARSALRAHRTRRARSQCAGARDRPRRL